LFILSCQDDDFNRRSKILRTIFIVRKITAIVE